MAWGATGSHLPLHTPLQVWSAPAFSLLSHFLSLFPVAILVWFRVTIARAPCCRGLSMYKKVRVNVHSAIEGCHPPSDCVSSLEAELGEPPRNR